MTLEIRKTIFVVNLQMYYRNIKLQVSVRNISSLVENMELEF